jgi:hypothetical protein
MKKILLTWYGITDLRASLGLESSIGPILNALISDEYEQIIILGYSDLTKSISDSMGTEIVDGNQTERFSEIANTEFAHKLFIKWLQNKLTEYSNKTSIHFEPVVLNTLNDTEGIYEAANRKLDELSKDKESVISFYLSPGTPVMAFVWAFAALRYPDLQKQLIASSTGGKPELVSLPDKWMEWHGRQIYTHDNVEHKFDVVFHLFGEQRMPSFLGIKQFESKKHVFLNSPKYPATVMKQFLDGFEFKEISVDPFSPEDTRVKVLKEINSIHGNPRIGFNLTGGTKLMYAGALSACKKVNGTPFYFNGPGNKLIYLNDFQTADTKCIDSVDTFIKLHGDGLSITNPGYWKDIEGINSQERTKLTKHLWANRSKIASMYKEMIPYSEGCKPFKKSNGVISIDFDRHYSATINIGTEHFEFKEWRDFGKYITGGWFEEFTYIQLLPLQDEGYIKDLRIGMELSIQQNTSSNSKSFESLKAIFGEMYQELDIVFTDGQKLFIVECKAGQIKSDHIMKLQNIVRHFGGIESRGIIAGCFPPNSSAVSKKIDDATSLKLISGQNFSQNLKDNIRSMITTFNNSSSISGEVKEIKTNGGMRIKKKLLGDKTTIK